MLGVLYTITNQAGNSFTINDYATKPNTIVLQNYPTFDLSIRSNIVDKDGQHGSVKLPSYYGRRNILFAGVIVGDDEDSVIQQRDLMIEVLGLPAQPTLENQGKVTIEFTDPRGRALSIGAYLNAPIQFARNIRDTYRLDFQIQLVSSDLSFETAGNPTQDNGVRGWEMGNTKIGTTIPLVVGKIYENVLSVNNIGNTNAFLKVRMYGGQNYTINHPKITNLTTGDSMSIETTLYNENEFVEIDGKTGKIINHNGDDLSGYIGDNSFFVGLSVGNNDLLYTSLENLDSIKSVLYSREQPTETFQTWHKSAII